MKKIAWLLALGMIACLLPIASAEVHHIKEDVAIGCIEKEEYKRLVKFAVDGDMEAWKTAVTQDVLLGTAILFEKGQTVYLEDTSIWEGMVKLRLQGETIGYWTAMENID